VFESGLFAAFKGRVGKIDAGEPSMGAQKSAQLEGASKPITETLGGNDVHGIGHYFVLTLTTETDAA